MFFGRKIMLDNLFQPISEEETTDLPSLGSVARRLPHSSAPAITFRLFALHVFQLHFTCTQHGTDEDHKAH